ncbi:MAG: YraN family protein [Paramuribaculum sp.]|nr:YraN family protein [Paramuribaculum sp.]
MAAHNEIGKWGEGLAREYLITKGYAIVDTNARIGKKELDIVAMHNSRIVFVEVKTRTGNADDALDSIDRKKITLLSRAAEAYVQAHNIPHDVQFDVIVITGNPDGEYELTHYPDAFMAPMLSYGKQ